MQKDEITVAFYHTRLEALEFYLKEEITSIQKRMNEVLRQLHESAMPELVREYLDSKAAPTTTRPSRPSQSKPKQELLPATAPVEKEAQL